LEKHQLINQTSGEIEVGTPKFILEAVREVLGTIGLDPASNREFNKVVKAGKYFDIGDDGLKQKWFGRVWMNHPFGQPEQACEIDRSKCKKKICQRRGYHIDQSRPGNADWINKLIQEYQEGRVEEAMCITFASTSESWFRPLFKFPKCFLIPRTNYYLLSGKPYTGATKGSVVTYFGKRSSIFARVFSDYGEIQFPYEERKR
jgi:hypothetical protein